MISRLADLGVRGVSMKRFWLASVALAAQLASPAMAADYPAIPPAYAPPAPPPPAIYSWWTGCYLGGNVGGAWTRAFYTHDNSTVVEDFTFIPKALIGGGQLGCQYQWDSLVFGLEGTWSWSNLQQSQPSVLLPARERSFGVDQIGTVTARVGYTWDNTMLYAKAGWAGVRVFARARNLATGELSDFTDFTSGWTVGVGMEHQPWQSIVLGVEANLYDVSGFDHSGVDTFGVPARFFNTSAPIWAISVRASYLFGPPIVTRYVN
jgi:outer membrane immunogenic protein